MKKKIIINNLRYLRQRSELVKIEEVKEIIKDLEDSLDLKKGIGLSAIQIGIPKQVGIIRLDNDSLNLINPIIIERKNKFRFKGERCLSFPGLELDTMRYMDIKINNNGIILELTGLKAVAVQHEIAHMKGRVILDDKWRK